MKRWIVGALVAAGLAAMLVGRAAPKSAFAPPPGGRDAPKAAPAAIEGRVVKVTDGDTITVLDASKKQHKIRLLDIDAPESSQAFGQKSKQHLAEMVAGRQVRVDWKETDRYGRILGTVWVPPTDVNLKMVQDGYAWAYHYTKNPAVLAAMAKAKAAKLGLWADPLAQDPWAYRKARKAAQEASRKERK